MLLSSSWCFDPAMDHHQGDGNSLLHQVAPFFPAILKCSFGTTAPLLRWRRGLIPQSRVGLNCQTRYEVKTPVAMGGSTSTSWDLKLTTMQTAGKKTPSCSSHSPSALLAQPPQEGRRGLIPQSRVGLNCQQTRYEVETPAAMGGSTSTAWDLN
jgi:hypothetical protein